MHLHDFKFESGYVFWCWVVLDFLTDSSLHHGSLERGNSIIMEESGLYLRNVFDYSSEVTDVIDLFLTLLARSLILALDQ